MSGKLRIFISSTMKDLANERSQVRDKLLSFNFEPVNAENLSSSPDTSWDALEQEIRSCNVFVLLLGERYGWIPTEGPHANEGKSITHLEFEEAKRRRIPVLAFLKKLSYEDTVREGDDAKKRDAFREAIRDYKDGYFTSVPFELATDLANNVGEAIIKMLSNTFAQAEVERRAESVNQIAAKLKEDAPPPIALEPAAINIPQPLIDAVTNKQAVLFAGAGFSLSAGMPSASAFSQRLTQVIRETSPNYNVNLVGSALAGIASDLQTIAGRAKLDGAIVDLLRVPYGVKPTSAHLQAVKVFDQIITTNFDTLFEEAAAATGQVIPLIFHEMDTANLPDKVIVKFHGSVHETSSLSLTEREILLLDRRCPNLWQAIVNLFSTKPVIVVGTSLRDPSIIRLFTEASDRMSGFFVAPDIDATTKARVGDWGLRCVDARANEFFDKLSGLIGGQ